MNASIVLILGHNYQTLSPKMDHNARFGVHAQPDICVDSMDAIHLLLLECFKTFLGCLEKCEKASWGICHCQSIMGYIMSY